MRTLFNQTILIGAHIAESLSLLNNDNMQNVVIINSLMAKVLPYNLIAVNTLLKSLLHSYIQKLENNMMDLTFNLTTFLELPPEYKLYIQTKGVYTIDVSATIRQVLDEIIADQIK
jgi:hypothetical protein